MSGQMIRKSNDYINMLNRVKEHLKIGSAVFANCNWCNLNMTIIC